MSIFGKVMGAIFGSSASAATPSVPGATPAAPTVDVAAILDKAVADKKQKLEWRTSIVDMMKALDLDSGLSSRKELAKELKYTGDTSDTATMNVWLHKQIVQQLVANGGKVPDSIKA